MGRKRHSRGNVKDANAKQAAYYKKYREELLEILVSIYDLGCISATVENSSVELGLRKRLILWLNKLSISIEAFAKAHRGDDLHPKMSAASHDNWQEHGTGQTSLIILEDTAVEIHSICKDFTGVLANERVDLSHLCRQLENLSIENVYQDSEELETLRAIRVAMFLRSLASQYRDQLQFEEKLVVEISVFLSNLYGGEASSAFEKPKRDAEMIRHWSQCLDERIYLDKLHWEALPDLIEEFQKSSYTSRMNDHPSELVQLFRSSDDDVHHVVQPRADFRIRVLAEQTVLGAVEAFLQGKSDEDDTKEAASTFLLLVGNSGSGKTHLCDQIEQKVGKDAELIRPLLPLDVMGSSVGEAEDVIVSLFGCSQDTSGKCVILLDDIEHLLGKAFAGPLRTEHTRTTIDEGEPHVTVRTRSVFLSIMDIFRVMGSRMNQNNSIQNGTLVICTARQVGDEMIDRFDKVFVLQPPDEEERRKLISSCLSIDSSLPPHEEGDALVTDLVESTTGRTYAEIAQYCRSASSFVVSSHSKCAPEKEREVTKQLRILRAMKESLRNMAPESLRTGSLDEVVDMNIYSARELLGDEMSSLHQVPSLPFPLFGNDAEEAWRQMDGLIVTPLCRAGALDQIMYGGGKSSGRAVCAGVLLTGPPGCGKSVLGRYCARVAAKILDSVTMLDVSCTSLVHKEVGGSERAVQLLFSAARAAAPCILIMDGIENIAAVRGNDNTTEGTMDRVLSTLLTELDGIDDNTGYPGSLNRRSGGIAVIGITHNPTWIDPALRRPGRLEKVIRLQLPDDEARRLIVLDQIKTLPIDFTSETSGVNATPRTHHDLADLVSSRCQYMSGAEVVAVCNDACVLSARRQIHHVEIASRQARATITVKDFISAIELRKKGSA